MNIQRLREARHGSFQDGRCVLPIALLFGCNSAPTGTAPGVAGGQALTPGITNYPMAYMKQPVLTKNTNKQNKAATPDRHRRRDLITSITGSDLYVRNTASAATPEVNVTFPITERPGRGARPRRLSRRHEGRLLAAPAARSRTSPTTIPSSRTGRSISTTPPPRRSRSSPTTTSPPATTSAPTSCRTDASSSPRRASSRPRRS